MQTFETERLILRPWTMDDLDDLYEYAKNPNVGPNAGWQTHSSKEVSAEVLQTFITEEENRAIVCKENSKVIGSLGLHPDKKRFDVNAKMLGYVLSQDYWDHGFMTEAVKGVIKFSFEDMNLTLLSVYHYPFNERSKHVIEKCGFQYEGTLRKGSTLFDGRVVDHVCYSITAEEYFDELIWKIY